MKYLQQKLKKAQEDIGIEPHDYLPVVFAEDTALFRLHFDWIPTLGFTAVYDVLARHMSCEMGPSGQRGSGKTGCSPSHPGSACAVAEGAFGGGGSGGAGGTFTSARRTLLYSTLNKTRWISRSWTWLASPMKIER